MKKILAVFILMVVFVSSASAEWLYASKGDTYVHVEPSRASSTIGVFLKGKKIWVEDHVYTEDGRNWCKVNYFGDTGYISDYYSTYDVYDPEEYTEVGNSTYGIEEEVEYEPEDYFQFTDQAEFEFVTTKYTRVRAWAGNDAPVIGSLRRDSYVWGSLIYTSEDGQAWLEVLWDDSQYGYIPTDTLQLTEGLFDGSYPRLAQVMEVCGNQVNVRADTDIYSDYIGTVHRGDIVYVSFYVCVDNGERRIWAYCNDEDGNGLGYISCKYLTVA